MQASEKSGRFIQFTSMANATDKSWNEFLLYIAKEHGEVFDFVAQNHNLCFSWWTSGKEHVYFL